MQIHLLTGVFGNAPTNPVLFVVALAGMAIGHVVTRIFRKKK